MSPSGEIPLDSVKIEKGVSNIGEPVRDTLFMGEAVAVKSSVVLSRRGRSGVRVRIVGSASVGWVEAAEAWGCAVEAVVVERGNYVVTKRRMALVTRSIPTTASRALTLPPVAGWWEGLFLTTVHTIEDASLSNQLFDAWKPWVAIFAYPGHLTRREGLQQLLPPPQTSYEKRMITCRHCQVGGVTSSRWHILHLSRLHDHPSRPSLMTMNRYPRPLQTALDDVIGGMMEHQVPSFEVRADVGNDVIGLVTNRAGIQSHVFSAAGVGPDLATLNKTERFFWVKAASVMSDEPVLRRVKMHELLSMLDYEGKVEARHWSKSEEDDVFSQRVLSPPAKIIRTFLGKAADAIAAVVFHEHVAAKPLAASAPRIKVGKTDDVPFTPLEGNVDTRLAAAQADDAEVDLSTWAMPGETQEQAAARKVFRSVALRWWKWHKTQKAWKWFNNHGQLPADRLAIEDCVGRIEACTYFQWPRGSRIFFWEFDEEFRNEFRDGIPFWHLSKPPRGMTHNLPSPSREAEVIAREKVFRMRYQGYIERYKVVKLVVGRFSVVKLMVDDEVLDIRVVWDSKSNGHNATLWAPGFMLDDCEDVKNMVVKWLSIPMGHYLEAGSPPQDYTQPESTFIKSKQGDVDVGGMFHNFQAHESERENLGVRWIETNHDGSLEKHEFYRFTVLHFGGRDSPYLACQGQNRVLEKCMGNRRDPKNRWQWEKVVLNLPCSQTYDPSIPRVMLLRKDGKLATRQATFVDDIHPTGRDQGNDDHTKLACKQLKSRMNSRGNQADDRKYREPSYTPGAWNGVIIHTDTPFPRMSTTQKKWTKLKAGLDWIWEVAAVVDVIETSGLRRIAGLAVNVTQVYSDARSYLKGIFNAIEAFRWGRDIDGWRLQAVMDQAELEAMLVEDDEDSLRSSPPAEGYPLETRITAEMICHIEALRTLFASDKPHSIPIRPTDADKIRFVIGDASAEGFGAGTQFPGLEFEGRDGLWMTDFASGGSNLREAQNLVNHLLADIRAGKHDGCEVWCFTDNAVWSYVWTKGLSSARHLFHLVLDLRVAAREHEVYLRTCHISGERMIATGMDGWSRGNHDAGISLGYDIRTLIPLHLSAWEVTGGTALDDWCKSWMGSDFHKPLTPEGWFEEGLLPGVHVWAPPPAAALIALKQLARSRQLRPYTTTHVIIIPRLLYQEEWQKRFEKEVDVWFVCHHGLVWPHSTFEPLMVGIRFPFSRSYPWELKQERERVVELGSALSKVSKTCHVQLGNHLRELWLCPRSVPPV